MPLPNPGMNFTAFDVLTAAQLDELVENVEALADGSGLDTGAVTGDKMATANIQALSLAPVGTTDATTSSSFADWFTIGTAAIPAWCTAVYIIISINGYYGATSASEHDIKVVLGTDSGRTMKIGRSSVSSSDKTNVFWSEAITPGATGNQTLKVQAKRTTGTGTNRLDANSDVTALILYR